jgi:hypothetical protein
MKWRGQVGPTERDTGSGTGIGLAGTAHNWGGYSGARETRPDAVQPLPH